MPDSNANPFWLLGGSHRRCVVEKVRVAAADAVPRVFFGRQRPKSFPHSVKVGLSGRTN